MRHGMSNRSGTSRFLRTRCCEGGSAGLLPDQAMIRRSQSPPNHGVTVDRRPQSPEVTERGPRSIRTNSVAFAASYGIRARPDGKQGCRRYRRSTELGIHEE